MSLIELDDNLKELSGSAMQIELNILDNFKNSTFKSELIQTPGDILFNGDGSISFIDARKNVIPTPSEGVLFEHIKNILNTSAKTYNVSWKNEDGEIRIVRTDVDEEIQTPSITFKVNYRKNGQWGRGAAGSGGGTRVIKPTLVKSIKDPRMANEELHILSMLYDSEIEISIHCSSSYEADKMLSWTEEMINHNLWYFKYSGIKDFQFMQRMEDKSRKIGEEIVYERTLKYFVQYEKLSWYSTSTLRSLILNLQVVN